MADHSSGVSTICCTRDWIFNGISPPIATKAARVALDRAILSAEGVRSIVLCNALIFGDALGPAARSVQLPLLIDDARDSGRSHYIGRGLNRWPTVHIADVVDLYFIALDVASARTFAFVERGEAAFGEMAATIADGLALGAPVSMPMEAAERRWGHEPARDSLASNSRVRGARARALNWLSRQPDAHQWLSSHLLSVLR